VEPLVFDIEEVECRMSDIEETSYSEERAKRSVRGSVIHTPKDFPFINPSVKGKES
jgi:hypothetical protein